MNRENFFKEMGKGFINTLKTVFEPIIEEELDSIDRTTNRFLGIQWLFLCRADYTFEKMNQFYVQNHSIFVIQKQGNMRAFSGSCPSCSNLLHLTPLLLTCKCFNCEKDYNFQTNNGELTFIELLIKKEEDGYYVGLKTSSNMQSIKGDSHA